MPEKDIRYYYKIERITHRPKAEDIVTIIETIQKEDLFLRRLAAMDIYLKEVEKIKGKYCPKSFKSYNLKKGIGYNIQLILVDKIEEEYYVVESTMKSKQEAVNAQKKEEEGIFTDLGLKALHNI